MANDLETLSAGEIQPYSEGPILAPLSPDTWGRTEVLTNQEIDDYQRQPQSPTLFGAAMPAGTSRAQVEAILGQLGGAFMADLSSLGYPAHMVNAAISFMTANATKAPYQVTRQHNFNLHGHDDWLGNAFGNMVQNLSGSAKAKQGFVTACLQWLAKACRQLAAGQQQVGTQPPRTAPSNVEDQLTDQQYAVLVKHNENVKAQTMGRLEQRWGQCFRQNLALAQAHLNKMTPVEIAHFDRYTGAWPWTHFLNSYDGLVGLFEMAIGVNSMPTNGPAIAQEILQIEALMRDPATRRAYLKDDALQGRYRQLLSLTLGGR